MKCWIRYVLPLVMALCLFLGSIFYSQASDAQETSGNTIDYSACITECPRLEDAIIKTCGNTYYYFGSCYNGSIILYVSPSPISVYGVPSGGSGKISISAHGLHIFNITTDYSSYKVTYSSSGSVGVGASFDMPTGFSNHDVYDDSGELFFHHPSPFQRVVRIQDWAAVMTEIIMILPLLILSLTSLLALRKGLKFISSFLRQA